MSEFGDESPPPPGGPPLDDSAQGLWPPCSSSGAGSKASALLSSVSSALSTGIGPGAAVGSHVQMPGKAKWTIQGATELAPGKWSYVLDLRGLTTKTVSGSDPAWQRAEVVVSDLERRVAECVARCKAEDIVGNVADWLADGGDVSPCAQMKDELRTTDMDTVRCLWSGGAADCIIVAAYADGKAYLTHADRSSAGSAADAVTALGPGAKVYLSSQYFNLSPEVAANAGTVQEIVDGLMKAGVEPTGIFGTGRLALDARTGRVLSKFPNPKPT